MPKVKKIVNLGDLPAKWEDGTLIHFTATQWKSLTKDIPIVKTTPKYGAGMEAYPIPDGDYIGQPTCIQGPCEICRSRVTGFGPEGIMTFECQCRRDTQKCPDLPDGGPSAGSCSLAFQRRGAAGFQLVCRSQNCTRTCHLRARVLGTGQWLIFCQCS